MQIEFSTTISELRLDTFVSGVTGLSRTRVKELILSKQLTANGEYKDPKYVLKRKDTISLQFTGGSRRQTADEEVVASAIQLNIIYEDQSYLVLNKPIGLVTHPGAGNPDGTLSNGVRSYLEQRGEYHFEAGQVGLVHRLDKETSGLIVYAKNTDTQKTLKQLFAERKVNKTYLAIVREVVEEAFTVDSPLGRASFHRRKFSSDSKNTKDAFTAFRPIQNNGTYTLLEAKPTTGRTHQIRVHLKEQNMPIVGDRLYGGESAERMMLHAYQLEFLDKGFVVDVPEEFYDTIRNP